MKELEDIVRELCAKVPSAIGAVFCDFEGEAVVCALGSADVPPEAEVLARHHVPREMALTMPVPEFLIRLAAAEPCALLRLFDQPGLKFGTGELAWLEIRYSEIEMLVRRLPNDFYLVMVLRRPAVSAEAKRFIGEASALLAAHVT